MTTCSGVGSKSMQTRSNDHFPATLIPKEMLLEVATEETVNWVINASPRLTEKEWRLQHGLEIPAIEGKVTK